MAEFFENLGKVISEKAEVVSKKTGEVVEIVAKKTEQTIEVQKIKGKIRTMQCENTKSLKAIGKLIYARYKKGEDLGEELTELCEAISEREDGIAEYKEAIAEIKGLDTCSNCGAHIDPKSKYCRECGSKVDEEAEFEEEE